MTYFSQNVIVPLEHHFAQNNLRIEATRAVKSVQRKWFKYMMVFAVGILLILNVGYIVRKFARRETKVTTTFDFANSTTRLLFPGLLMCIPQIFQLSRISHQELLYLYRQKRPGFENRKQWMPPLESVVLHLSINGRSVNASSLFVNRNDKFYKVCWQTSNHKFVSRSPGTLQSIDLILNVAEYEDIVHPKSMYLRHIEISPFDQNTDASSDPQNSIYLSPGRHSLVTLRTIKEDSTVRPKNSVACVNRVDHEICQRIVEQSYINKSCLGSRTPQNISIEGYVQCMGKPIDGRKVCGASCTRTIYKSFKSEAKLKFAKNLGNLQIPSKSVDVIKMRLRKSVDLNSIYDIEYRKGIVKRLPEFISSTKTVHRLLSRRSVLVCAPSLPEVTFLSDFPDARDQFNLFRTNNHVLISGSRKYKTFGEIHFLAATRLLLDALSSKKGLDFFYMNYLSIGRNNNLLSVNKEWLRFVEMHWRNMSIGYEMFEEIQTSVQNVYSIITGLEVKESILKFPSYETSLVMKREETAYIADLNRVWDCHLRGGIQAPFTNNWVKTSNRYLMINDTKLYNEKLFGSTFLKKWYKKERVQNKATGLPIYIDFTQHTKVLVPKHVLYHCSFYKCTAHIWEKQLGLDRPFSYTNINARYKVDSGYTLFVLNNILQSDDRWGVRPSPMFDICEEESCACNVATPGDFLSPLYLPHNSTSGEILKASNKRTLNHVIKRNMASGRAMYNSLATCGKYVDSLERRSINFFKYFEKTIIRQHDRSITMMVAFSRAYESVRKGYRLRAFSYLLRTYGLKRRIGRLQIYLNRVMNGSSFEELATFLVRKGKIMVGEVQLVLFDLSTAYKEYLDYFRYNWAAVDNAWLIMSLRPTTDDAFFLADIFNNTAKTMLRNEILKLPRLVELMKKCMLHSHILLEQHYLPLHRSLMKWLAEVNYFIWRAKLYVDSKEISPSFMDRNIAVVSIFYETLDIRYETNTLRYSLSKYNSDWGNILTMYYGLEAFSFLQLITFVVAVAIRYKNKWQK